MDRDSAFDKVIDVLSDIATTIFIIAFDSLILFMGTALVGFRFDVLQCIGLAILFYFINYKIAHSMAVGLETAIQHFIGVIVHEVDDDE